MNRNCLFVTCSELKSAIAFLESIFNEEIRGSVNGNYNSTSPLPLDGCLPVLSLLVKQKHFKILSFFG